MTLCEIFLEELLEISEVKQRLEGVACAQDTGVQASEWLAFPEKAMLQRNNHGIVDVCIADRGEAKWENSFACVLAAQMQDECRGPLLPEILNCEIPLLECAIGREKVQMIDRLIEISDILRVIHPWLLLLA